MMKYSFFPGCSMGSTARSYRLSLEYVCRKIGMDLYEIDGWNCCGATSAHVMNEVMGLALPALSLAKAEKDFPELDIATGCAACYSRLKTAAHHCKNDPQVRYQVEKTIGFPYEAKRDVLNFMDIFGTEEAMAAMQEKINRPLKGLKVACYYGCLNVRPAAITGAADRENPMTMENIISLSGADCIDWAFKTECCGGAHQNDATTETRPLVDVIIRNAVNNGAQCIVTACPLCNMNLEMRQKEYARIFGTPRIPVFAFTELIAIAMGAHWNEIALDAHYTDASKIIAEAIRAGKEADVK